MIQQHLFGQPQTEVTSDDYYTPKWVFDTLDLEFDLDVASPPGGPPFVPCKRYFTQEDDGLAQEWHGRVWMNPPYSAPRLWIERFLEHGNGVALLPFAKSRAFMSLWNSSAKMVYAADPGLVGLLFHRHGKKEQIMFPVVLIAMGNENIAALEPFGVVR